MCRALLVLLVAVGCSPQHSESSAEEPAAAEAVRVAGIGDSNTEGEPVIPVKSYADRIAGVVNFGVPGSTSQNWDSDDSMIDNRIGPAHSAEAFALCSINIGTNDARIGFSVAKYRSHVEGIVGRCKAMGIPRSIVFGPMACVDGVIDETVRRYGVALAEIAAADASVTLGTNFEELRLAGTFDEWPSDWFDICHWGPETQAVIAELVEADYGGAISSGAEE